MTDVSVARPRRTLAFLRLRPDEAGQRRAFDLIVAGFAALLLAPVALLVALAILLESGRPILFAQVRLGRGGLPFVMYKFRKFSPRAGAEGSPLTLEGDVRMTTVGKVLMATKLDELPQIWNVLRGDMAVVGPRPESLAFADCFHDGFEEVLDHKPGLLGPCQILFRSESTLHARSVDPQRFYREVLFPAKARADIAYFRTRTLASDFGVTLRGGLTVLVPGAVPETAPDGTALVSIPPRDAGPPVQGTA
ncbi:sugar transferase [Methylorubrum extorquens]